MKIRNAYICESCQEVFEGAPYGRCPMCNSGALYTLGWLTFSAEERSLWFAGISGHGQKVGLLKPRPRMLLRNLPAVRRATPALPRV